MSSLENVQEIGGLSTVLRELRDKDPETGLLTSSSLYQGLLREVARSERYGNKLSVLHVELRGLRDSNRKIILPLASHLADNIRTIDYAGRWSDTVFLVVLPETDAAGAQLFVDKLEGILKDPAFAEAQGNGLEVRVTVAEWENGEDAASLLDKIER